jgi:WD40 repeat protein
MRALQMRDGGSAEGHGGEVFSCLYTRDGAFLLSAGWDGSLRLWVAENGQAVTALPASTKPLSCCALSPDGTTWLAGSMDGVLSAWDAVSHQPKWNFIAHIRPLSAIQYSPDSRYLATASWDRKLMLRRAGNESEGRPLNGHHDIVSGCRWLPDGKQLLSWSHDGTLRLWDAETGRGLACLQGHADRITAACLSDDGQWAVSGGCDGVVKLWDVQRRAEVRSVQQNAEVRGCWCLRDNSSVLTINADGWMVLWSLPDFEVQSELASDLRPLCGDLSPSGSEVVLGTESGQLHFLAIDGVAEKPLQTTATPLFKPKTGVITRFLGKPKIDRSYQYSCPSCGHAAETESLPRDAVRCSKCNRLLRVCAEVAQLQAQ